MTIQCRSRTRSIIVQCLSHHRKHLDTGGGRHRDCQWPRKSPPHNVSLTPLPQSLPVALTENLNGIVSTCCDLVFESCGLQIAFQITEKWAAQSVKY
ncbi:hypothetical protein CEXT_248311 [Caerostris extrusa]|uniref:Uncharacterized protein n=1 Tax=Caerostris extrusa TaxID=172846 RepID=A0AAV4XMS6_CAEEX|nr:hypothetical protein CEXT_248311 [Caerostris extrusa]